MDVRTTARAAVRGLGLAILGISGSLGLFIVSVVSFALTPVGAGLFLVPVVTPVVRAHANLRRRLALEWTGVRIQEPYRRPPRFQGGFAGVMERYRWIVKDPATWRDMLWLIVDATAGFTLGIAAVTLPAYGPYGWALALGLWRPIVAATGGNEWYTFVRVTGQTTAIYAGLLGVVYTGLGAWLTPRVLQGHTRQAAALLGPTRQRELEMRVTRLTETRSDALDTQAAELRRIERNLHDGAQARLVAMGMSLLNLPPSDDDNRRVLAVLAYLNRG